MWMTANVDLVTSDVYCTHLVSKKALALTIDGIFLKPSSALSKPSNILDLFLIAFTK